MFGILIKIRPFNGLRYSMAAIAGTMLIFALAFLYVPEQSAAGEPKHGGSLTVALESDFRGFDVLKTTDNVSVSTAANIIEEQLFNMDDKGNLIPVLGLSATPSDDGKTWTVKLRRGVTFHDGTMFNADAVVHHWKRILDPKNRFRGRVFIKPIQSVDKIGDYTIRFSLAHNWAPFLGVISGTAGFQRFIPSPKATEGGTHNRAPVGTGPFMFREWKPDDRFVVVRNPNYWAKGKPYLDQITFLFLPDTQTRFASLKAGGADMIWTDRGNTIVRAMKDKSLVTYQGDSNGAHIFLLNNSKPPLDNPDVRRALAHAWSQELCIKTCYKDTIPTVHDPFGTSPACGDVGYREHDFEKARHLIAKYGKPLEIRFVHTNTVRGREASGVARQLFKKIGVTVKSEPVEFLQMIKMVFKGDYQMAGWRISHNSDMGPSLFTHFFSKSPHNVTRYKNPEMDRLLLAQRSEADPEKRKATLCSIARLINEDAPVLYFGGRRSYAFALPKVKGISSVKGGIIQLSEAWTDK